MRVLLRHAVVVDTPSHSPQPVALSAAKLSQLDHLTVPPSIVSPAPAKKHGGDLLWMDELEQHLVHVLTSDSRDTHTGASGIVEPDKYNGEDAMDIAEVSFPKPSLPTRTQSIPIPPPLLPPSSSAVSSEFDNLGMKEDQELIEDQEMLEYSSPPPSPSPSPSPPSLALCSHHGYSRSALHSLKEFWTNRHEDWIHANSYSISRTYGGLMNPARPSLRLDTTLAQSSSSSPLDTTTTPTLSPPSAYSPSPSSNSPTANVPCLPYSGLSPSLPIFPRVGDLSQLRDPRTATIDRAFCHVPLHSISKMIFTHEATQLKSPPSEDLPTSSITCEVSAMSVYSDDSTLVEEESLDCSKNTGLDWFTRWKVIADKLGGTLLPDGMLVDKLFDRSDSSTSWVSDSDGESHSTVSRPQSPAPRKFFFALDDDDFSDRDYDDDDDDDFGTNSRRGQSSFIRISVQTVVQGGIPGGTLMRPSVDVFGV